jgi:hypothetical protein
MDRREKESLAQVQKEENSYHLHILIQRAFQVVKAQLDQPDDQIHEFSRHRTNEFTRAQIFVEIDCHLWVKAEQAR